MGLKEEKKTTSIKTSTLYDGAVLCKGGECTGKNRKLSTTTVTTNTHSKDGGNEANSLKPTLKGKSANHEEVDENVKANNSPDHQQQQYYVDVTDINEMDYSPARRKPPIHN
ncbi:hypothetical protein HS088_TW23G00585 [Tripterygium wilfordii]|uniref:Uncharacterized protein n=1 Tax=Tripterygium wilfordii TaxID=458696 RepID=A0A7J7BVZ0_TRIWF|nr:hypothetical protein HS088_TW23G00585 [Tripterygium wilfordii]